MRSKYVPSRFTILGVSKGRLTDNVALEPGPISQNLRDSCSDRRIRSVHVR
jgi:hypothetical protein